MADPFAYVQKLTQMRDANAASPGTAAYTGPSPLLAAQRDIAALQSQMKAFSSQSATNPYAASTSPSSYSSNADGSLASRVAKSLRTLESGSAQGNYNARSPEQSSNAARGAYQFLPSTYASVARSAGLNGSDWSPQNQDAVATWYINSLLKQYNNDVPSVAATWYLGHVPNSPAAWNAPPPGMNSLTARQYADRILANM